MTSIVALGVFIAMLRHPERAQGQDRCCSCLSLPISTTQYTTAKVAAVADRVPDAVARSDGDDRRADARARRAARRQAPVLRRDDVLLPRELLRSHRRAPDLGHGSLGGRRHRGHEHLGERVPDDRPAGLPGIREYVDGPIAVWSPTILTILGVEAAVIVLSLGLAFFVQSRKKDFV